MGSGPRGALLLLDRLGSNIADGVGATLCFFSGAAKVTGAALGARSVLIRLKTVLGRKSKISKQRRKIATLKAEEAMPATSSMSVGEITRELCV